MLLYFQKIISGPFKEQRPKPISVLQLCTRNDASGFQKHLQVPSL